ncbi:hypothetical protein [Ornithinimicrobium kibberense]|uniref:hypothetical protein n=1 Tax=Ornithinimicrobium kibberense TaxID=282060 RepID=UPI00361F2104
MDQPAHHDRGEQHADDPQRRAQQPGRHRLPAGPGHRRVTVRRGPVVCMAPIKEVPPARTVRRTPPGLTN